LARRATAKKRSLRKLPSPSPDNPRPLI
jgi:hypothetical protein